MTHADSRDRAVLAFGFVAALTIAIAIQSQGSQAAAGDKAGSGAPAALEGRHLYLVPAGAQGVAAIETAAARTIARYQAFTLVSADGGANAILRAAGADRRDDMRSVITEAGKRHPARAKALNAGAGEALAVVQFVGPVKGAWVDSLRATGATIVTYTAQNAYIVHGDAAALVGLAKDDAVRGVTRFTAADKTAPGIPASGTVGVAVQTLAGPPGAAAREIVAAGERLRPDSELNGVVTKFAALDAARVDELAADLGVVAVEPAVEPKLLDERAAEIIRGRLTGGTTPVGPGYLAFLNAEGFPTSRMRFTVDITDEGIDKGILPPPAGSHNDLFVNGNAAAATRLDYHQEFGTDPDPRDCGGHGTNVASIATGFNTQTGADREDAQGFNYGLGIAPRARVGNTKIFTCTNTFSPGVPFSTLRSNAYAEGARISNNSWGSTVGGAYNTDSQTMDALTRDAQPGTAGNQQLVHVFSAGNDGNSVGGPANTIGAPGTAKNVITVGASESVRATGTDGCGVTDAGANSAKDIIHFSSRGPTDDGRIKPDVVAPGTHVTGAQPQVGVDYDGSGTCTPQFPGGSTLYSLVSGTSQAAPEISGLSALIRDWYDREESPGAQVPSPALTKAILVNTATDVVGGNDGQGFTNHHIPTQIQGWGRGNLGNVVDGTAREFVDQTQRLSATGQRRRNVYSVVDDTEPLKVTLAWSDTPGPTTGDAFVNDLDLVVHAGGATYKGNVFANGQSTTGGTADPRNNVENVFLPAGTSGSFAVDVNATNVAGDGVPGNADTTDQDFALVVSNAAPSSGPLLAHDLVTATVAGFHDGDTAIEPGESFRLRERLRNLGTASATGIASVLTESQGSLSVLQPNSVFPDIAAGAVGNNMPRFLARLDPSYPCAATAHFTLNVATSQESFAIPIDVPTGFEITGNPDSSDVPKAIPDNGTVESTLNMVGGGEIRDLDVRNLDITHTWDEDLIITLIAPGGAPSAVLVNQRGADGNNFNDTTLDDEATTPIADGVAPFNGTFRPDTPLSVFDGLSPLGTWTLRISDVFSGETGTLAAWGLRNRFGTCN
jgi:subtilisin-like proprotein convertase family protein